MCVCLRSMQWWWFFWLYTKREKEKALRILCSHNIMDGSNSCELFTCGNYVMHTLGCWKYMRASKTRVHNIYLHFMCTKLLLFLFSCLLSLTSCFCLTSRSKNYKFLLWHIKKDFRWKSLNFSFYYVIFKSLRENIKALESVFNINRELYIFDDVPLILFFSP